MPSDKEMGDANSTPHNDNDNDNDNAKSMLQKLNRIWNEEQTAIVYKMGAESTVWILHVNRATSKKLPALSMSTVEPLILPPDSV
jgi:hypothetical protein